MRKGRCMKWSKGRTRCMKRAKSTSRHRRGHGGGANRGKHCVRYKRTSAGRRCAKFS